jgi:ATP-binding cassette subfamily C (CFTR/MRP) protein 1
VNAKHGHWGKSPISCQLMRNGFKVGESTDAAVQLTKTNLTQCLQNYFPLDLTTYLNSIWSSPLQIVLSLIFLWQQLGPSSLGGVSVIIIMIPVTKTVAQWMGSMQKKLMKAKDKRVELNAEVMGGMKVIKFQAWEESFQKRILALREEELSQLFRYYVGTAFSRMLWVITPMMVAVATFGAYVWSGHKLDVASALTALALFNILRFPLFMLPQSKCFLFSLRPLCNSTTLFQRLSSNSLCNHSHQCSCGSYG